MRPAKPLKLDNKARPQKRGLLPIWVLFVALLITMISTGYGYYLENGELKDQLELQLKQIEALQARLGSD